MIRREEKARKLKVKRTDLETFFLLKNIVGKFCCLVAAAGVEEIDLWGIL